MDIETELLYASRMILAALIGGLIGWEREHHASDAGIRTYMAISIGACAFSLISAHAGNDPTRIAAQVVTGIGFIGAGVIFQGKGVLQDSRPPQRFGRQRRRAWPALSGCMCWRFSREG